MNKIVVKPGCIALAGLSAALLGLAHPAAAEIITPTAPLSLFNGRDLSAFDIWLGGFKRENKDNVFSVVERDGAPAIRVSGEHWGGLVTKRQFADYVLAFDYAWGAATFGERKTKARNSGVLLHCSGELGNSNETFTAPWMRSVEFEMIEGGTGDIILVRGFDRPGGNLSLPVELTATTDGQSIRWYPGGKPLRFPNDGVKPRGRIWWKDRDPAFADTLGFRGAKDVEKTLGQWNHVELTCRGGGVRFLLNGVVVNEASDGNYTFGKLMLQSEGAEVFFRQIELRPLPALKVAAMARAEEFPHELVEFGPAPAEAVFAGTGADTWDRNIRERGWVMREDDGWHLWFTGYRDSKDTRRLGYATSPDGLRWTRWPENPLLAQSWVEDICVMKRDGTYFMFAEGVDDIAHLLTSTDRVHWTDHGDLDIRKTNGKPIERGPFGTPSAWFENGVWRLFYERNDAMVYAATSRDMKTWTNVTDLPVLKRGPEDYDRHGVALNQIIKHGGRYYACYHATAHPAWETWSTCLAVSDDLVRWRKYPGNPVLPVEAAHPQRSSGFLVHDGTQFRLYTAHPDLRVRFGKPTPP